MKDWQTIALKEKHLCPSCQQPVPLGTWNMMQSGKMKYCWMCRYAHWDIPLRHAGGSAIQDNQDREGWDRIRGQG